MFIFLINVLSYISVFLCFLMIVFSYKNIEMPSQSAKSPIQLNESEDNPASFYELKVYSEWRQDPISWNNLLKRTCSHIEKPFVKKSWFGFIQTSLWPEQELLSYWSVLLPWLISVSPSGQYVALLQDGLLEIRCSRDDYTTVVGRASVSKDQIAQCRRMVWSPNSVIIAISSSEGTVSVYDFLAAHLFTIPKPAQKSINKRYVVGLELINSPIKLDDWSVALIVVYSDGMVHLYQVSEEGLYKETISVNLSLSGISSATFCHKYQVLFIATKPNNYVPATFKDSSIRSGISGWKLIPKQPFFKQMFPTEEEQNMANRGNFFFKIKSCLNSMCCIAKMIVSPNSNWIASYNCCGGIKVWYNPSLRLHRRWDEVDRKHQSILESDVSNKKRLPLPVDIEWLSDEALVVSWDNGTISVHNIHNFGVTYGSDPKLVHGRLRVSSSLAFKGFLALECELVFISIFGEENVVEDDEDEKSEWLDATSEFIQAVLYAITDNMDYYKPARRPNQLTRRIYRLLGIKSVTPEERYFRYLEDEQYDKALRLAKAYKLDIDKVYQKQWKVNTVSSFTICEYLVNIHDEAWVLNECMSRVPETLSSLHLLIDFALNRTDFANIFPHIKFEDRDEINIDSLTKDQKLKLQTRLQIFRYLDKLEIYELILQKQNLQYDMTFFEKIREKHMVEIAILYAHEGNFRAVETILRNRSSDVSSYLLVILNNFPESLNPEKYSNILAKCNSEGEPINIPNESNRQYDWVQSYKFRDLIESEKLSFKYKAPLLISAEYITEWYRVRAVEIEWFSGIIENSVKLLRLGKCFNVLDLDELLADFLTLEVLVIQLGFVDLDFLTYKQWPLLDKGYKLLEKSSDESFNEDYSKYLVPFLNRCNFKCDKERFELILNIMIKRSVTNFKQTLEFFRFILDFKDNMSLIGTIDEFVSMVDACCYSYEKLDFISESLLVIDNVIDFLNSLTNRHDYRTSLNTMYTIRDELKAVEILQKYKIVKPIIVIHKTKHLEKEIAEIIQDMTKLIVKIVLKLPTLNTAKLQTLLEDILYLQEICFTSFPIETCYQIFASAMLGAESMDLIEFSANFICCRKQEEFSKPVSYDKSIELILKTAKSYFNCSRTHLDGPMYLAKACLHIVKDDHKEVIKELDLIQAVRLLSEFGVNLLPLQIRNCEDRMKLIECVLSKDKSAYKNFEKVYKLACKLSISSEDYSKRYAIINIRLAEESIKLADFKYCSELCENLLNHICPDGWDICLKLGSSLEFKNSEFKLKLLNFSFIYAPSKLLYAINQKRNAMEKEVLFQKLSSNSYINKLVTKIKADSDENDEYLNLQALIKHSEKSADRSERRTEKLEIYQDDKQITFDLAVYLLNLLYCEKSAINDNSLKVLDRILGECAKLNLNNDSRVGVSLSMLTCINNKDLLEDIFANLPQDSFTFQLATYFYSILKCINSPELSNSKDFLNENASKVVHRVFSDGEDEFSKMIVKYKIKMDEYFQAKTANSLNCGIDTRRFISDIDYRRDTISGLAMSTDLDNALTAIELATRNHISPEEMAVLHLESYLKEPSPIPLEKLQKSLENPTISKIISDYPELLKNRLLNIFEHLDGCNYPTLMIFFTLYHEVDGVNSFHSLTAKQHLKLMKKVKSTSQAINYVDLITSKDNLLEVLQPALNVPDNFNNVVKLVKNLPESIRGTFNVNVLYRKKAVDEFLILISTSSSSLKHCIKQVENIFNKLLIKVDVSDLKLFLIETLWDRKSAIAFDYEDRRQIILTLVSCISNRDDYRENVKYLTNLIQERLDNMDKIWNIDEQNLPLSNFLKNYLFDLEEIGNNNDKKLQLMKKIAYDSKITKDELFVAYKASDLHCKLNELFEIFSKDDNFSKNTDVTCSESTFPQEMQLLSQENQLRYDLDCSKFSQDNESQSFELRFEKLLTECKTTAQIKILYIMLDDLRSSEALIDIRTYQIRLLHKLVAIKGYDSFNLVAKLMDEAALDKKEILELVTNNKLTGDMLTLAWICIQGNTPELEKLATEFINDLNANEIHNIGKRIKTLPWDLVKLLTSSKCFKQIINDEENYLIAQDIVKVLAEIHLLPEASTLHMNINSIPESLRSFNTALNLLHSY